MNFKSLTTSWILEFRDRLKSSERLKFLEVLQFSKFPRIFGALRSFEPSYFPDTFKNFDSSVDFQGFLAVSKLPKLHKFSRLSRFPKVPEAFGDLGTLRIFREFDRLRISKAFSEIINIPTTFPVK